jgi:uncharacterized integral membrane protein (TIGR00697 family)
VAYCCGEFVNSYILARLKVLTNGRHLWLRTIGSTVFGEAVDSSIFYPLAFWGAGIFPDERIPQIMLMQFLVKTGVEVLFTPRHLLGRRHPQARRARGLVRPRHRLQPVPLRSPKDPVAP